MKKILYIAPSSYPVIMAECIVNMKLLQALSNSGKFEIDVISRDHPEKQYKVEPIESYNVKLNRIHVSALDRSINIKTIWLNLLTVLRFGFTFRGAHWASQVIPVCKKWVKEKRYDYIISKDYPSFLVAAYLKKHFDLKWVATWNDPYPFQLFPEPYGRWPNAELTYTSKRKIHYMRQADVHVFPSERLMNYMCKCMDLSDKITTVIPHVIVKPATFKFNSDELSILVSGNMRKPRDPRPLLNAISLFYKETPHAKISFSILGSVDKDIPELINSLGLSSHVKLLQPVSYTESLEIAKKYQVCIVLEAPMEEGIYLPTKVSDCMQDGNVIFAISPVNGTLHDFYNEGFIGYFANNTDVGKIKEELDKIYTDFHNGILQEKATINPSLLADNVVEKYLDF